jgi:hypothetical protein
VWERQTNENRLFLKCVKTYHRMQNIGGFKNQAKNSNSSVMNKIRGVNLRIGKTQDLKKISKIFQFFYFFSCGMVKYRQLSTVFCEI